jgi:hypothetical protein
MSNAQSLLGTVFLNPSLLVSQGDEKTIHLIERRDKEVAKISDSLVLRNHSQIAFSCQNSVCVREDGF